MYVEPKPCSPEDFPSNEQPVEGMKSLTVERAAVCRYQENVVYATRGELELKLQILLPGPMPMPGDPPPEPKPCVVYVQGSAWLPQMIYQAIPQQANLAKRDFVFAEVEYRPSTVASFPAQIIDAKAAVRFMRKNAAEFGVDPDRIILMGSSSGAHTAVMAGITGDDVLPCADYPDISASVSAIVDYFAPTDISRMCEQPSTMDHRGAESPEGILLGRVDVLKNPQLVYPTVPMNYISRERKIPPILIMHGAKDRIVPFQQSILLYEKLRECGKEVDFYKIVGADHGGGEFWSAPVLDIVEAFIRANI